MTSKIFSEYSKKKEHLINKNTPAVTIVAACISADTGVGPSIASGNHVCKPTWADLPTAPINKNIQIKLIKIILKPKNKKLAVESSLTTENTTQYSTLLKKKNIKIIPNKSPISPTLLTINAFRAALFA